jgi:predicted enzyme related to lactoylglutathione lyase
MKLSHVHCRARDLPAAARWFQQVWQVTPVFHNERMVWLSFGELGVILDAGPADSTVTLGFDTEDCDADYRRVTGRGAEMIEAPQDRPRGARAAYLKGPGKLAKGFALDVPAGYGSQESEARIADAYALSNRLTSSNEVVRLLVSPYPRSCARIK